MAAMNITKEFLKLLQKTLSKVHDIFFKTSKLLDPRQQSISHGRGEFSRKIKKDKMKKQIRQWSY